MELNQRFNMSVLNNCFKIDHNGLRRIHYAFDRFLKIDHSANANDYYGYSRVCCVIANQFFGMKEKIEAENFAEMLAPVIYPFNESVRNASFILDTEEGNGSPRSYTKPTHSVAKWSHPDFMIPMGLRGRENTLRRLRYIHGLRNPCLNVDAERGVLPMINEFSQANIHDIFPTCHGSNSLYYEIEKVLNTNPETEKPLGKLLKYKFNGYDFEVRDNIIALIVAIIQLRKIIEENEGVSCFYQDIQTWKPKTPTSKQVAKPKRHRRTTRQREHEVLSQGTRDRLALTDEAGNASRHNVIVGASALPTPDAQDKSGPTFSRVMRTNSGGTTAKIFRKDSGSPVHAKGKSKKSSKEQKQTSTNAAPSTCNQPKENRLKEVEDSFSALTINDKLNDMIDSVSSFVEQSKENHSKRQGEDEVPIQGRSPR